MKTRSVKELLQVMLDNFDLFDVGVCDGLCSFVSKLWYFSGIINSIENALIKEYMEENKPQQTYDSIYWFSPYAKEPRKQWLIEEIKKHE